MRIPGCDVAHVTDDLDFLSPIIGTFGPDQLMGLVFCFSRVWWTMYDPSL